MKCSKCGSKTKPGIAIQQTYTGMSDFPGTNTVCTMSADGPGKLIKCEKCPACGKSVTV